MVNSSSISHLNRKRGISTIIGGIIFVVLLTTGFSTFFLAMDVQSDTIDAHRDISDLIRKKTQEQFTVAVATDDTNPWHQLGIQVTNEGSNPVEISNIWIINKSQLNEPTKSIPIDFSDAFVPAGYGLSILENQRLVIDPALIPGDEDLYGIKVVSTLGTIKKVDLTVGGNDNMRVELIAIPPHVKVGQNVTLTMYVENIGNSRLLSVVPFGNYPNIAPPFTSPVPPAPTPVDLDPGEASFFTWEYETTGSVGSFVVFDSYATAQDEASGFIVNSNVAVEKIQLNEPAELIVLTQDLLARPEIFMILPSPFGDDSQKALWGVNVVNPTAQDLYVSKLVIAAIPNRVLIGDAVFPDFGACSTTNIPPTPAGTWSCPVQNQLMWKNTAAPALVPGYSTVPFLVAAKPGSLAGLSSDLLETIPIQVNVFTTLGQFGKSGYGTSMHNGGSSLANVYLTSVAGSISTANIISKVDAIASGTTINLMASLADFDTSSSKVIDQTVSRLIINTPKGWTNPVIVNAPGYNMLPTQSYSDGSHQISGTLIDDIDSGAGGDAQTIEFQITAPTVTTTQLYVMYILADGTVTSTGNTMALGPLAEVVLQVIP